MSARLQNVLIGLFATAIASPVFALPVIPGAAGFGIDTAAGRGGTVHRVTNLNETGAGSLGACVAASGPRVCIFEVSGTIRLTKDLTVRNPYITIAGQTAPAPGIMLRGAALRIVTSDVLVQHVRVRVGDDSTGPGYDNRDALKIEASAENPIRNIVIDHCSFSWAVDETATAWMYWDNVSFLNSIFAEPLHESLHSKGPHGMGVLFGPTNGKASMVGNLIAHTIERNALARSQQFVFVNNVVYNRANMDVDLQNENGQTSLNSVVGNVFLRGPDYTRANKPVLIRTSGTISLLGGSKVYVADNAALEATSDPWSVVSSLTALLSGARVSDPPAWPAQLTAKKTTGDAVLESVLTNAGARPADRDSVDRRIVRSVRERSGGIINCVSNDGSARCQKNAGGWPTLAKNTRKLNLPDNPNAKQASGYTNLEVWLHSMAASVEGRATAGAPGAATLSLKR